MATTADQMKRAALVREVSERLDREVALLADLQGPKIRVERFEHGCVDLQPGRVFTLDAEDTATPGDRERVWRELQGPAARREARRRPVAWTTA